MWRNREVVGVDVESVRRPWVWEEDEVVEAVAAATVVRGAADVALRQRLDERRAEADILFSFLLVSLYMILCLVVLLVPIPNSIPRKEEGEQLVAKQEGEVEDALQ